MELRQLEYLVAVADSGGFTRAATAVHVAQPSLSQGIRSLEAELGVELFARLGRSVAPTPAGELVIEAARLVLRDMADLRAVAAAARGVRAGRLDLASLPTLAVDPLARLIGAFRHEHPDVVVRVVEPEEATTIDRLVSSGRAELGLTDITTGAQALQRVELFRQDVLAVSPPSSDGAGQPMTASELARQPLIVTPPDTSTRRLLEQVLARVGSPANVVVEISQREAILPLVLAGAGTSLLPAPLAEEAAARGAVVRPLRPAISRRVGLVHRAAALSPAASAFVSLAVDATR